MLTIFSLNLEAFTVINFSYKYLQILLKDISNIILGRIKTVRPDLLSVFSGVSQGDKHDLKSQEVNKRTSPLIIFQ